MKVEAVSPLRSVPSQQDINELIAGQLVSIHDQLDHIMMELAALHLVVRALTGRLAKDDPTLQDILDGKWTDTGDG